MPDFRLDWTMGLSARGDLVRDGTRFAEDGGLATAVALSLFTNRRAEAGDELPDGSRDRQGYWGDAIAQVPGDRYGSRLYQLRRAKRTTETLVRAREYALEALAWALEDGVAADIRVGASYGPARRDRLDLDIEFDRPTGELQRFSFQWDRIEGVISLAA